ncbi:MAG: thiamine-phosphate kinase [Thermodesulfobacteriota bacterium]
MFKKNLKKHIKFYFITDHNSKKDSMYNQVESAVKGGASIVQYRNKNLLPEQIDEVYKIRNFLKLNKIPFIINDNILLAKAVDADGVHLGQEDFSPLQAKQVIGKDKIIGISVSDYKEFENTDFSDCDYIGLGPVFATNTKKDAKKACGTELITDITKKTDLPVAAIGGINQENAQKVINAGASGICVISALTASDNIRSKALELSDILKISPAQPEYKWKNEFELIEKLKCFESFKKNLRVGAGDDSALLNSIENPVISTDAQIEDVHFRLSFQNFYEIGFKSVSITLSDLCASYAEPVSVFINLGLPDYVSDNDIENLYKGINKNLLKHNCSLGGGNIAKSLKLSIDLFAIGNGKHIFPQRSKAKPDQLICSTGYLGISKAGLEILENNIKGYDFLVDAFKKPEPKFYEADILRKNDIECVTDISDGLYGDVLHIAKSSELTAELDPETMKVHPELEKYCREFDKNPYDYIISGGEDYELLFTCSVSQYEKIRKKIKNSFIAGRFIKFSKDFIKSDITGRSYNHGQNKVSE